ncbi:hypothetical protein FHR83_009218 [Actinoplanes campanulatus]|uniref:Universal stress protein family protein n=1 Tax=Actinoplanes campanulatus TaxID=113559 RepID=A0A7W5AT30_9ACTN|nr:hypothetical protein [Actinoplanes campanulatus]
MDPESKGLVVAGVNDSPAGRQAVRTGAREAALRGCRLELAHAFNWVPTIDRAPALDRAALMERAVADAREAAPGVPVETLLVEGEPAHRAVAPVPCRGADPDRRRWPAGAHLPAAGGPYGAGRGPRSRHGAGHPGSVRVGPGGGCQRLGRLLAGAGFRLRHGGPPTGGARRDAGLGSGGGEGSTGRSGPGGRPAGTRVRGDRDVAGRRRGSRRGAAGGGPVRGPGSAGSPRLASLLRPAGLGGSAPPTRASSRA